MEVGSLRAYERKRDFSRTSEPGAETDESVSAGERFVIQQHSARRLHWDLRLEREGVLASWALPRGVPQDPKQNRKAVRTEDHPLKYLDFEGEIPAGEYGAGTMEVWDRGSYEVHEWTEGKVVVTLAGERVDGRYALFHTGPEEKDWMIHRVDPPADPDWEPLPEKLRPMTATSGGLPADEERFGYEIKWDGVRALARSEPGRLRIHDRDLEDITARYPELRRLNRQLGARSALLDGVIIAFGPDGRPSRERLEQRMTPTSESTIRRRSKQAPATYVAFDLLHLDGRSLLDQAYESRRERLEELQLEGPNWQVPAYHRGDGGALLDASARLGLTGMIAKRLDSRYEPGHRSPAWIDFSALTR